MIRHTPNCVSQGVWNSEKSYRLEGTTLKTDNGRLTTDWRYGPTFDCRDDWADDLFANIDRELGGIWRILEADRPTGGSLTPGTQFDSKITSGILNTSDCDTPTPRKDKTIVMTVTGSNLPFEIVSIAAKVTTRRG
jgi:hypothetical protein